MREDQFIKLSQAGENVQIEYKTCYEQISDSLYETVCSFLNHSGGHILVGVKDNGEIAGVNPDKATTCRGISLPPSRIRICSCPVPTSHRKY